jgi:Uma2 family endonuclease
MLAVQNPPRKRWTRAECERLESLGIFDQQRVELIDGELIDKLAKTRPEIDASSLVIGWLMPVFGTHRWNYAAPIDVAHEDNPRNQPEPDMIVLTREYSESRYWTDTPQPRDLELVVEIADTSLAFDLTVKAALYARAGIAEYWVLDVPGRRLIVHRDPESAQYGSVTAYNEQAGVAPLSAPNSVFQVRDVFPA